VLANSSTTNGKLVTNSRRQNECIRGMVQLATDKNRLTPVLEAHERTILQNAERFLSAAVDLKRWWETDGQAVERFELARAFNRPGNAFGFFGNVALSDRTSLPVMGSVQEMFYDSPKASATAPGGGGSWMQRQIREFVLRYFMRVSSFREPDAFVDPPSSSSSPQTLSWCPRPRDSREGFGFQQLFYRRHGEESIGVFPEQERFAIVDLREIGELYDWIILKVRIFDFDVSAHLGGAGGPDLMFRLHEESYVIVSRAFIVDRTRPRPGVAGEYGLGYAFIKSPARELLAYGPGQFDAALELIQFQVLESGATNVRMLFLANRPEQIVNLSLNPMHWGFRLADLFSLGLMSRWLGSGKAMLESLPFSQISFDPVYTYVAAMNLLSAGYAGRQLCISKTQLDKSFLLQHFMQHYKTIVGSLLTWRQIPDWLDRAALPEWVVTGRSS
jgi:hypothetical protein